MRCKFLARKEFPKIFVFLKVRLKKLVYGKEGRIKKRKGVRLCMSIDLLSRFGSFSLPDLFGSTSFVGTEVDLE